MQKDDDLCLCCGTISHTSFSQLVEAAMTGGYSSISIWPHHYEDARQQGMNDKDIRLILEDHGLVISELDPLLNWLPGATPGPQASESERAIFGPTDDFFFHIADVIGARHLNVVQAFGPRMDTDFVAEAFAGVCDRASQHNLKCSLEFLPWSGIPDMKVALEIVQKAGRANGGIMLDTWHHFRSGGGSEDLLSLPGSIITAIQFNDASPKPANDIVDETIHGRLLPGEGAIDLVSILRALDHIGCQAPIGVEVFSDDLNKLTPAEAARKAGDATRAVLAKARV